MSNKQNDIINEAKKEAEEEKVFDWKADQNYRKMKSIGFNKSDKTVDRIWEYETKMLPDREKDSPMKSMVSFITNVFGSECFAEGYALGRKDQDKYVEETM